MFPHIYVHELMSNSRNLRISYWYHGQDAVQEIYLDEVANGFIVNALVEDEDDFFSCHFQVDKTGHVQFCYCECGGCTRRIPCAHIGAVLLKLNQLEVSSFPFHYDRDEWNEHFYQVRQDAKIKQELQHTQDFLSQKKEKYALQLTSHLSLEKYDLVPIFTVSENGTLYLEYRIGNAKTYVLRSISTLLDNIEEQNEVSYGKKLSFVHTWDAFTEEAQAQIKFMRHASFVHRQIMERQSAYMFGQRDFARLGRSIELIPPLYEAFYETYKTYEFKNFRFIKEKRIELKLEENDTYYALTLIKPNVHCYLTPNGVYALNRNQSGKFEMSIYPVDEHHNVEDLLQMFASHEVMIRKEDFDDFYKYVFQPIEDYIYVENMPTCLVNPYDQIYLYGDVNANGQIEFQVYYEDDDKNRKPGFDPDFERNYDQDIVEQSFRLYTNQIDEKTGKAYFDDNDEKTYAFIQERLPFLNDFAEIFVTDALQKLGQPVHYSMQIGIRLVNDLISVDIDSLDIPKMEVGEVLAKYQKKQKFHRLKSGQLINLDSPELADLSDLLARYHVDVKEVQKGEFKLSKNRLFSLANEQSEDDFVKINRDASFNQLLDHFETSAQHYALSPHYENILRDYQKEGYQWLRTLCDYGLNGILADDMGLGKTIQVICLLDHIEHTKPSIVICPSSLIYNWEDEIKRFAEDLTPLCIVGDQNSRQTLLSGDLSGQVLITSYDYLRRDIEHYASIDFQYVILDESQYIKNQNTKNARAVKQLSGQHRLALSGTPIENSLAELWSVFDFLMPQYLFNYHYFRQQYESDIVKNHDEKKIKALRQMVSPFILRRHKKDVLLELPEKIETKQLIPFTNNERELYYSYLAQINDELKTYLNVSATMDKVAILAMLTRLREICCDPRLLFENINQPSSKMNACLDLLVNYKENNQKVLLFSSFTSLFDLLEPELKRNDISYLKITGQTSKEKRKAAVAAFQEGQADVFLISLKAGGTGLNLTRAEAVIHFDPWWNISSQNQATDRAYRIGQTHNVQVHQLIMKESVEEKIMNLQAKKKELSDLFVEQSEGNIGSLSKEEIMELFRI